jgi:hypothetical protein
MLLLSFGAVGGVDAVNAADDALDKINLNLNLF